MQFSLTRNGLGPVGGRGSRNRTEGTLFSAPGGLVGCSGGGGKPDEPGRRENRADSGFGLTWAGEDHKLELRVEIEKHSKQALVW